ncbi:type III-A CRISPR-associated RAMP protein Csm4 [Pectinatus frisingensis]|uniref:type III-A CRISPR-associated RAMP protein Csm4 n=1 Tax=Pectinatus frisingensis TaxID=865 RepID=UPI0018C5AA38|nr:type III-A CRISPR-associated RAMP protein Csm4 [Pectinatus frisingensis]
MNYSIYKLSFTAPCRFGPSAAGAGLNKSDIACQADTLFSALANECAAFYGTDKLQIFKDMVQTGALLVSDLLPYKDDTLFLPKPLWALEHKREEEESLNTIKSRMSGAKKLKKLQYIPVYDFENYIDCIKEGKSYITDNNKIESIDDIYEKQLLERVNCRGEENLPYFVEQVVFAEKCGLYFIIGYNDESQSKVINELVKLLSYSGIGGKRSSGYGKFTYEVIDLAAQDVGEDTSTLYQLLTTGKGSIYMNISDLIPDKDEIAALLESFYRLVPRSGFVTDGGYKATPFKRNRYFAIMHGSCFKKPLKGSIIDAGNGGSHPVYRYGKGLYVRLDL